MRPEDEQPYLDVIEEEDVDFLDEGEEETYEPELENETFAELDFLFDRVQKFLEEQSLDIGSFAEHDDWYNFMLTFLDEE